MIQPQYAQAFPQPATGASAVTINIVEPKAYGSPQQEMMPNYTNPMYNYPQASAYSQSPAQNPQFYQQYAYQPQMPYAYPQPQYMQQQNMYSQPQMPYAYAQQQTQAPEILPVPQQNMPAPVIRPEMNQIPQEQTAPSQPSAPVEQPQAATPPVQIDQPNPAEQVDINALVQGLKSPDPAVKEEALTKIATLSQAAPEVAQQVLNDEIMQSLADILKNDPSQQSQPQQGNAPSFTGFFNKKSKKAKAHEEAKQEPQTVQQQPQPQQGAPSPEDKIKVMAAFDLAILNDMFRNEYDKFKQEQGPNAQVKNLQITQLYGYGELSNMVQNTSSPDLKLAAIQSISYMAKPEDKPAVQESLQAALNDKEPLIQQAAKEAIIKLDDMNGVQAQQAPVQQAA